MHHKTRFLYIYLDSSRILVDQYAVPYILLELK